MIGQNQQVNFLYYNKPLLHTCIQRTCPIINSYADCNNQHAKKFVSDSPELVNFAIGLVNSVLNLREGQVMFFGRIQITEIL